MKFIMVLSLLALTGACNANSPVIKNKEDVAAVKKEQLKAEDKKEAIYPADRDRKRQRAIGRRRQHRERKNGIHSVTKDRYRPVAGASQPVGTAPGSRLDRRTCRSDGNR